MIGRFSYLFGVTMRIRLMASVFLLIAAMWAIPANAQTVTGSIQGVVTDATGGVLPGATIQVRNVETGATRDLTTNERGFYSVTFLAVGRYTVSAKLAGFAT